uniref:Uncharacterized protein n=1 Tax=Leersia perrieri TaxID=77586 RepID=A0A0D9X7V0_9ORYZ
MAEIEAALLPPAVQPQRVRWGHPVAAVVAGTLRGVAYVVMFSFLAATWVSAAAAALAVASLWVYGEDSPVAAASAEVLTAACVAWGELGVLASPILLCRGLLELSEAREGGAAAGDATKAQAPPSGGRRPWTVLASVHDLLWLGRTRWFAASGAHAGQGLLSRKTRFCDCGYRPLRWLCDGMLRRCSQHADLPGEGYAEVKGRNGQSTDIES